MYNVHALKVHVVVLGFIIAGSAERKEGDDEELCHEPGDCGSLETEPTGNTLTCTPYKENHRVTQSME